MIVDLLDALDACMDTLRGYIVAHNESVSDELRAAYWQARQWIDAWRDEVQPLVVYPEPGPVLNCQHPYDRDYAFLHPDAREEGWQITCCCTVCGKVDEPQWIGKKKPKKKDKKAQAMTAP